jgi:hypothetical protein
MIRYLIRQDQTCSVTIKLDLKFDCPAVLPSSLARQSFQLGQTCLYLFRICHLDLSGCIQRLRLVVNLKQISCPCTWVRTDLFSLVHRALGLSGSWALLGRAQGLSGTLAHGHFGPGLGHLGSWAHLGSRDHGQS